MKNDKKSLLHNNIVLDNVSPNKVVPMNPSPAAAMADPEDSEWSFEKYIGRPGDASLTPRNIPVHGALTVHDSERSDHSEGDS